MIDTQDFRKISVFEDLTEDQLGWLVEHAQEISAEPGEVIFRPGDAADQMLVFLEGELEARTEQGDRRIWFASAGDVGGLLPFSRLQKIQAVARARTRLRIAGLHKRFFPEMLQRIPVLTERLVTLMLDRVREYTRNSEQRDKLEALGKLSAGLAHELNNPAAAVQRAAAGLLEVRTNLRGAYLRLDRQNLAPEQRTFIAQCEEDALTRMQDPASAPLSSLERSDREQELEDWMQAHKITEPWKLSPMLVEAQLDPPKLDAIAQGIGGEALHDVLIRINYALVAARIIEEIRQGAGRISDLVRAIKQYTYMDQGSEQEIDIHSGIESTLTILGHKLRAKAIEVERSYDTSIPKICGFGAELNQVWTNIIVNAIEALPEAGCIRIRTSQDMGDVVVEVEDNGPGIPPAVLPHIFEPFFTTKGVGEGTGLGLDTAMRVIRKHHGDIHVDSKPGATIFHVCIPLHRTGT